MRRSPRREGPRRGRPSVEDGPAHTERGSAVVEFVLVAIVLAALFAAILQIALVLHVRNTMVAAAAEGARYGANADRTPEDGAQRTRAMIGSALSSRLVDEVDAGHDIAGGVPTVYVRVSTRMPAVGWLGGLARLTVTGHAFAEDVGPA